MNKASVIWRNEMNEEDDGRKEEERPNDLECGDKGKFSGKL